MIEKKYDPYYECQKCGSNEIHVVGETKGPYEGKLGYMVWECKKCGNNMISDDADQLWDYKGEFKRK